MEPSRVKKRYFGCAGKRKIKSIRQLYLLLSIVALFWRMILYKIETDSIKHLLEIRLEIGL